MAHAQYQQLQTRAPTMEDIEQKYSQLPPQYRQAVFERQQREYQQGLLQQQQPSTQTLRSSPARNVSASLSSSPTRGVGSGSGGGAFSRVASGAWSATRQRIASAPLTTVYRKDRDSDSSSTTSSTIGLSRTHWKPDSSTNVCMWPGCRLEFGLFDRRHHCRKCGEIFCSTHCSKEVPLDHTLDFNPAEGVQSRACIGCYDDYEQWQGRVPSTRGNRSGAPTQEHTSRDNSLTTTTTSSSENGSSVFSHKPNVGRIPDGFLGGDPTLESIGREDIVRQSTSTKIAIKRRPSSEETMMPMASVPHDWSWSTF